MYMCVCVIYQLRFICLSHFPTWFQQTERWTYFHNLKLSVTTWLFLHRFRQGFFDSSGMQIVVPLSCLNFPIRTGSKNTRLWLISTWSESHIWGQAPSSALCWSQSIDGGLEFIPFQHKNQVGKFQQNSVLKHIQAPTKTLPILGQTKNSGTPPRLFFTTSVQEKIPYGLEKHKGKKVRWLIFFLSLPRRFV